MVLDGNLHQDLGLQVAVELDLMDLVVVVNRCIEKHTKGRGKVLKM
jgi:hypothetical protein